MNYSKYIYLDNAATTPMDPRVIEEVNRHFKETYGNASSLHSVGQKAGQVLLKSREMVASLINAHREDIFFTSSGTEADNMAIFGVVSRNKEVTCVALRIGNLINFRAHKILLKSMVNYF